MDSFGERRGHFRGTEVPLRVSGRSLGICAASGPPVEKQTSRLPVNLAYPIGDFLVPDVDVVDLLAKGSDEPTGCLRNGAGG